jgi:hypothetical protein
MFLTGDSRSMRGSRKARSLPMMMVDDVLKGSSLFSVEGLDLGAVFAPTYQAVLC